MANLLLLLLLSTFASITLAYNNVSICHHSANCYDLEDIFRNHSLQLDHTEFILDDQTYTLCQESNYTLQDLSDITFTGSRSKGSFITCCSDVGVNFINILGIAFTNITFLNCRAKHISTTNLETDFEFFYAGLYFEGCKDMRMNFVTVTAAENATGLVMYDPQGTNIFQDCTFLNNSFRKGKTVSTSGVEIKGGGGGVYLEFTYCKPFKTCGNDLTITEIRNVVVTFNDCTFKDNTARYLGELTKFKHTLMGGRNHLSLGHGGGLSFFIRGNNSNIELSVRNCQFEGNEADRGGGIYVRLNNFAYGNTISITNCSFERNECPFSISTKGGALALTDFVNEFDYANGEQHNEFIVENCTFTENFAMRGGAVSIYWVQQGATVDQITCFLISNSNTGKLGTAVYVNQKEVKSEGLVANITVLNVSFVENCANFYDKLRQDFPVEMGLGALYISSSTVKFFYHINFVNNDGTALALIGTKLVIDDCLAEFHGNKGINGGAIAMLGASKMKVSKTVTMTFVKNTAISHGGAIYAKYIGRQNLISDANCFIGPIDEEPNPGKWGIVMTFIDNAGNGGRCHNAIYTTSVLRCTPINNDTERANVLKTFKWEGWSYKASEKLTGCGHKISSDIGDITIKKDSIPVVAYPGWEMTLPIGTFDDFEHNITDLAQFSANFDDNNSCVLRTNGSKDVIVWKDKLTLNARQDCNFTLTLYSAGQRVWLLSVNVTMKSCPPGFKYEESGYCACDMTRGRLLRCNGNTHKAKISRNVWIGKLNDTYYEVMTCPYYYCAKQNDTYTILEYKLEDQNLCAPYRTGVLCGECVPKFGPAINSPKYECANCSNSSEDIIKYVAATYLPLISLFTLLVLFDIRLTSGPANAFILYGQVITTTFTLDANGGIPVEDVTNSSGIPPNLNYLLEAYKYPYYMFNLKFIEPFLPLLCLSPEIDSLQVILIESGVALLPVVLIVLIVILLKLKEYCNCSAASNGRLTHFSRQWSRRISNSLLPSFASILLLSYTKLCFVSTALVDTVEYNGTLRPHLAPYRTTNNLEFGSGIFILSTFVAMTPILLLDYPVRAIERVVSKSDVLTAFYPHTKLHILLDLFQGCYKKDMRFFAGVFFLFRLVINLSFVLSETWIEGFVIKQLTVMAMILLIVCLKPYRRNLNYVNYVDIFIFSLLAFQNCFSYYIFVTYTVDPNERAEKYGAYFYIQYATVFLPLVYMIIFILYRIKAIKKITSSLYNTLQQKSQCLCSRHPTSAEEYSIISREEERVHYQSLRIDQCSESGATNERNSPVDLSASGKEEYHSESNSQQASQSRLSDYEAFPKPHPQLRCQSRNYTQ